MMLTNPHLWAARLLLCAVLVDLTCCKPSPSSNPGNRPPTANETTSQSEEGAVHRLGTADVSVFLRRVLPPTVRLVELKSDPPAPLLNPLVGSNAWAVNVRLALAPTEDLLGPAPVRDARAFREVTDALDELIRWSDAYARSPYAPLYPGLAVKAPMDPLPYLLTVMQAKERTLAPVYAKVAAEWVVDHWQFSLLDLPLPRLGVPRSSFRGNVVVQGSPDVERFLAAANAAISPAKERKAAIERRYQDDLAQATRPGTLYRGQIRWRNVTLPAEVRFLPAPEKDPRQAQFELRLPSAPGYRYVFSAKLAAAVPLPLAPKADGSDTPAIAAMYTPVPPSDLVINPVYYSGKDDMGATLPGELIVGMEPGNPEHDLPLGLRSRRLEGAVVVLGSNELMLSAQQTP